MKLRTLRSIVILILFAVACHKQETPATVAATPPSLTPMPEMAGMPMSNEPVPDRNAPVLAAAGQISGVRPLFFDNSTIVTEQAILLSPNPLTLMHRCCCSILMRHANDDHERRRAH